MVTDVLNLDTGEILVYTLPPKEAVRAAFYQERSKGIAYFCDFPPAEVVVKVSEDGRVVYAGEFFAANK